MKPRWELATLLALAFVVGFTIRHLGVKKEDDANAFSGWTVRGGLRVGSPGMLFAKLGNGAGGASAWLYSDAGYAASALGIYPEVPEEPLIALNPAGSRGDVVSALLRLAGGNHSGVIVMKTRQHGDGLVLGLGLDDPEEKPYISCSKPCSLFGS